MAYQATTGLGVAAKIVTTGNVTPNNPTPGYNAVTLSLSGASGFPETFQLNPVIEDAGGNTITPGTAFTLSAVAASSPGSFTLTSVAASTGDPGTAVYTGTVTGGGSNAYEGYTFVVTGFDDAVNNGTFQCVASTTTTLTLNNQAAIADTHAGTAKAQEGTAVYTGTITGGGSNAFAGLTFVVAGFSAANNNGSFIATASTTTTLTLANAFATAVTAAATATTEEIVGGNTLKYVAYGYKTLSGNTYQPSGTSTAVVTVSANGLITAVAEGGSIVEVSYPTFNNSVGNVVSSGNIMNGLPINKIYSEVSVNVVA
jgi:hypothetical protein